MTIPATTLRQQVLWSNSQDLWVTGLQPMASGAVGGRGRFPLQGCGGLCRWEGSAAVTLLG